MKKLSPVSFFRRPRTILFSLAIIILVASFGVSVSSNSSRPEEPQSASKASPIISQQGKVTLNSPLFTNPLFSALMPAVQITATMTDQIVSDGPDAGKAGINEVIRYTVTITNGSDPANNVAFSLTTNTGTQLVSNSVIVSPIAFNDTYNSVGNMTLDTTTIGTLNSCSSPLRSVKCNDSLNSSNTTTTLTKFASTQAGLDAGPTPDGTNTVTTAHGTVKLDAEGAFIYNPTAGYEGTDEFWYRLSNGAGTDDGKVTITVGGGNGIVWFIDNDPPAASTNVGTQANPFTSLATFAGVNNGTGTGDTKPDANNTIFLFESGAVYTGPVTLLAGQKFIGQDSTVSLVTLGAPTAQPGNAYPALNSGGTTVTIANGAGNGITLGSGNTASGFSLSGVTGIALSGNNFGTLALSDVNVNSSGQAISLTTGTLTGNGSTTATFGTIMSAGGTNGILLSGVAGTMTATGGSLTGTATGPTFSVVGGTVSVTYSGGITQAANNAAVSVTGGHTGTITFQTGTISATNGTGLQFSNADGTYNFNGTTTLSGSGDEGIDILADSAGTFSFGANTSITSPNGIAFNVDGSPSTSTANVTYSGNITQANNFAMVNVTNHNTGTITFQTGTLSATAGTGLQFSNADSTTSYNFNGTTTLNGGDAGIDILSGSSGTFTFGTGVNITRANSAGGNAGFNLLSSDATVTYSGNINMGTSTSSMIVIDNHDAGTITFQTGTLQTTNTGAIGIRVDNSGGGTINFNNASKTLNTGGSAAVSLGGANGGGTINFGGGGLQITTTSGAGFKSTGGGTVTVGTGGNVNSISSGTGTALEITNTNIGTSGVTFRSISANGAVNGIVLNSTGTTAGTHGGLTVTGDGGGSSNGTGGTIQNTTGVGVLLTTTRDVNLNYLNITSTGDDGIRGQGVTNFTLTRSNLTTCGNATAENGIQFGEATGSVAGVFGNVTISNVAVSASAGNNLHVRNTSGILDSFAVSNSSFNNLNDTFGANSFLFEMADTAVCTLGTVTSSTFQNNSPQRALEVQTHGSATITKFTVQTSTFNDNGIHASFTQDTSSNLTFNFLNNGTLASPMTTCVLQAINVFTSSTSTGGIIRGRIEGNFIGNEAVAGSGSTQGNGIRVVVQGRTAGTLLINNNRIRQVGQTSGSNGMILDFLGAVATSQPTTQSDLTLTNNDVATNAPVGTSPLEAILIRVDNQGSPARLRADIRANTVPTTGTFGYPSFDGNGGQLSYVESVPTAEGQLVDNAPTPSANADAELDEQTTGTASNVYGDPGIALIAGPINLPPVASLQLRDNPRNQYYARTDDAPENNSSNSFIALLDNNGSSSDPMARIRRVVTVEPSNESDEPAGSNAQSQNRYAPLPQAEAGAHFSPVARKESAWKFNNPFVASAEERVPATTETAASINPSNEQAAQMQLAHGDSKRKGAEQKAAATAPVMASPPSGEVINLNLGNLAGGKVVKIIFDVKVEGTHPVEKYTNQGSITADSLSPTPVLTDDPDIAGSANPTETLGDRYNVDAVLTGAPTGPDVTTSDNITFEAVVTPNQGSGVTPNGFVQFKDGASNLGAPVACNDNGGNTCKATKQTTLSAGAHTITAEYLGGTNHDLDTSDSLSYTAIACSNTLEVNSTNDVDDGTCDNAHCSLREAINNICANGTITFNSSVTGFIQIDTTALPNLNKNMTITGPGAGVLEVRGRQTAGSEIRVFNVTGTATVNISGLTITKGGSITGGAGINIASGATLNLSDSAVTFNIGTLVGGGGILNGGTLNLERSTVSNNSVTGVAGGGILNTGTLTVKNSTISTNTVNGGMSGGGVYTSGTATFVNSTIANNFAAVAGGGIFSSGTTNIGNTIVAYTAASSGGAAVADLDGSFTSQGNNWIQDKGSATGLVASDQSGDPQIQTILTNNGGPTQTHAPLKGSPVVEAGSDTVATGLTTDQRGTGFFRKADSADAGTTQTVDIGAVEVIPTISDIANKTDGVEDTSITGYSFNVGDAAIGIDSITASATTNPSLIQSITVNNGTTATPDLTITPAANTSGTATITVTVNKTIAGTLLSQSDTFDVTFTEVNDTPVPVNDTLSNIAEDSGVYSIPLATLSGNDSPGPNEGTQTLTVTGVSNATGGTVQINGANVEFTPTADFNGPAGFDYTVQDNGTTSGSNDFKSAVGHASFNITAVNDKPVVTTSVGTTAFVEGNNVASTPVAVDSALTVTDVDSATLASATVAITTNFQAGEDTLAFVNNSAATFGNIQVDSFAAGVLTLSSPGATATVTQWQNALRAVTYTNSSDTPNTSTRTVSFQVNDGAGANNLSTVVTKNISVTATNDAPTLTNTGLTVNEGSTGNTIGSGALSLSDVDDTTLTFQVVSVPSNGTLKKSGTAMGVNDTFTQADITSNLITYDHNGSETTSDSFGFFGSDGTNSTGNQTFNITVTPQNDAPTLAANNALTVVPGTAGTIDNTKLSVTDVDNVAADLTFTVGTAPAHGTLKKNGTTVNSGGTFTQVDINSGFITYTHNGDAATNDSFTFTVSDGAGGTIGSTAFNININCSASTVVTNTNDSGTGSLREAVITACQGNTVTFDATAFAPAGSPYTITLTTGELTINKNLTITGPTNATVIVSGNKGDANPAKRSRVFNVASGTVAISNLTITDGEATGNGGAIYNEGTLTLDNITVSNSVASGGHGGGIFNLGALTIKNSTLSGNYAKFVPITGGDGGAIDSDGGTLNVYNSTISGNTADGGGGGMHNCGNSTATLVNVTVTNNRADNDNLSPGEGGGIEQVSSNTITLRNTIVAGNLRGTGGSETSDDVSGAFIIQNTLIQTPGTATFTDQGANKLNQNPLLGALASNGGPTRTHLLLPGSPAINAGSNSFITNPPFSGPPFTDQRGTGFSRITGGGVDMGAVEVNYAISATAGTPQTAAIGTAFATQLQATVTESGNPQSGITVTFTAPNSGASGTFQTSGTNVDTATTNASGVATAPVFTANATAGGPYNVVASLAGGSPSANFALTNGKANQTINFGALAGKTFGDADFAISATATSGLAVTFAASGQCTVAGNMVHITGAGSCTITASQAGDSNYNAAPNVQQSFNIAKANQTINFGALANKTFGDAPFNVSATATSGLAVTFSSQTPAFCGVSGTTVTIFGGGTCTVRASQAGDSNYNAAPNVDQSFTIQKADHTITFNDPPDRTFGDADFLLNPFASTSSGQAVVFSVTGNCTLSTFDEVVTKYQVHLTGAGSCTVTASHPGNQNYNPAPSVQQTFLIAKAASTTTVTSSSNPSAPGQSVTFTATVTSPAGTPTGTVQFKDNGNNIGAAVALNGSGVATVTTSSLTTGAHVITAEYSGDANFNASAGTLAGGQTVNINTTVSINDVSAFEGDGETKNFVFTITLSQASNIAVSVNFATANGTATAGSDYQATSGTVTFNVGDLTKTVTVAVNGDTTNEPNETFFVNLSNAQGTNIADNQGMGTILNDDGPGVQFSASSYTFQEGVAQGFGTVTVNRTGDVSQPLTVDYMTSDQSGATPCQTNNNGFASDRCDYGTAAGRLQFAAGEASKTIAIVVINDGYVEPSEQFTIQLSNPQGGALNTPQTATITITDNDTQVATQNPIDDLDFFLFMMYTDFMGRVPDPAGFQFWRDRMTVNCPAGQVCDRTDTAFRFFDADEFEERGYFVYLLYHAGLGRRPTYAEWVQDVAKINGYKTVAEQEAAKDALVNEFMLRQEFLNLYQGSQTGQTFVDALIQKSGVSPASRQQLIDNYQTVGRAKTLRAFMQTQEVLNAFFDRAFVTMLYYGLLRRDAEPGGFAFWMQKLNETNKNYKFLIGGFLNSDEYRFRYAQITLNP